MLGVRPSELLGLLWSDVNFERGIIEIKRVQMKRSGELVEATKTVAGRRVIPMTPVLREMLLDWRTRCPLAHGTTHRVFPAAEGGPLYYNNYRTRCWLPTLKRLGLPLVTPHSARHSFISTLQSAGVDVATVAKLAGHKSPAVTLGYYSHSMGGSEAAMATLDGAFGAAPVSGTVTE
jgi:integrase